MIRRENNLTALRCRIEIRDRQPVVVSQLYRGPETMGVPAFTPLQALGLPDVMRPREVDPYQLGIDGTPIKEQLLHAVDLTGHGEPVWLQIGRGAHQLAALPWEALASKPIGRAMLRIPNFLVNPFQTGDSRRIAICASGPLAKGAEQVFEHIEILLAVFDAIFRNEPHADEKPKPDVAIFTDLDAFWDMEGRIGQLREHFDRLEIAMPNPEEADRYGRTERVRGPIRQTDRLANPWLQWIADHYAETGADLVHFICPGYFYDDNGALALAETPTRNTDRRWSRFVGAQELALFFDLLGCSGMGFTTTGADIWHIGTRMLAYELSWIRPGPILVAPPTGEFDLLVNTYGALFDCREYDADLAGDMQLCAHPNALFHPVEDHHVDIVPEESDFTRGVLAIERGRDDGFAKIASAAPEAPELYSRGPRYDRGARHPRKDYKQQILRSELASLSSVRTKSQIEEVQDKGALRALDFIARITQSD